MKRSRAAILAMACVSTTLVGCVKPPPPQPPVNPVTAALIANMQAHANGQPLLQTAFKTAIAGTTTRIVFAENLNPDCSVRDVPTLRILTPPTYGVTTIKEIEDFGSYAAFTPLAVCNKNKARGASLDYIANAGYAGPDTLVYEALFSNGADVTVTVKLTVK